MMKQTFAVMCEVLQPIGCYRPQTVEALPTHALASVATLDTGGLASFRGDQRPGNCFPTVSTLIQPL